MQWPRSKLCHQGVLYQYYFTPEGKRACSLEGFHQGEGCVFTRFPSHRNASHFFLYFYFFFGWKSTKEKTRCTLILTYLGAKIAGYYQTQSSWASLYFPKYFCLHFQARGTYRLSLSTGQSAGNSKGRLELLKDSSPMIDCFPELTFDTWNIVTF